MSATATIAITVGVAVAVLVGFFIVYYLGNVANSIYDVKVGVRKDFDKKVKELQEWVDKDTKQRINWMRDENKEDSKRFKEVVEGQLEEAVEDLKMNMDRLRADVTSLQGQLANMESGKTARRLAGSADMNVADSGPVIPDPALGDIRIIDEDHKAAPDMAAVKDGPTPPPPPASSKRAGGRASVEEKAERRKRKKRVDEFEAFDKFSEEFKS